MYIHRKNKNFLEQVQEFAEILNEVRPASFFFYSTPNDVVGTTILNLYRKRMNRFQINLTDHAFWLGARCIDKCIEFRDYGASISVNERKISKDKITKLPFYPIIDNNKNFKDIRFILKKARK